MVVKRSRENRFQTRATYVLVTRRARKMREIRRGVGLGLGCLALRGEEWTRTVLYSK